MINRCLGLLLLILSSTAGMAFSQEITLSVPDSTVEAGAVLLVPVSVSELTTEDQVIAGEWKFTVSSNILSITGVTKDGTLLQGVNTVFNVTNGDFAFSSTEPVTGSGVMIYLQVQVREDALKFQESVIGISSALFNEGEPAVQTNSGTFRIKGIALNPKKPSPPLVEGQSFQFNLTGDVADPAVWTSSDNTIATVSSTGLVEGIIPGSVKIFVEDAEGQRDSTDLFRVEPATLLDLTLGVGDADVSQSLEGTVPIEVSDLTGLDITSGEISLSFTSSKLEIIGYSSEGTLLEGRPAPVINEVDNTVTIAFAGVTPLEGEGPLLNIQFRVLREATGSAFFTPLSVLFNETFEAATYPGTITILNAPEIIVEQEDEEITIGETTVFTVVSGGTPPYRWSSSDETIATIDENTGELQGLRRGVVEVIATDSENFESIPATLTVNDVTVFFPDITVADFETFSVSLQTTDISGLGVNSFESEISYDDTMLLFEGVEVNGTLSDGYTISASEENGIIQLAAAGTSNLEGEGALVNLFFSVLGTVDFGTISSLIPVEVQFNEPGPATPTATLKEGTVSFIENNLPEKVTLNIPADNSENIGLLPLFSWQDAARAEAYQFELSLNQDVSSPFVSETGIVITEYQTAEELSPLTSYYWRVRASNVDGNGPWSDIFTFTTQPGTAQAPVLTFPEDGAVNVPVNTTFQWEVSQFSEEYLIEISTDSNFETIPFSATVQDLFFEVENLSFETLYYWRVTGVNSLGTGETSSVFSFTTEEETTGPDPVVDAAASGVQATSPHLADGADASTVTVTLVDTDGEAFTGLGEGGFLIDLTGSAVASAISETPTNGIYSFSVTNTIAETVTVTVTADGVQLNDQPQILFQEPDDPQPVPDPPVSLQITETGNGLQLQWNALTEEFTSQYHIYRGNDIFNLSLLDAIDSGIFTFNDNSVPSGITFYAVTAVNNAGLESDKSLAKSFINDELNATSNWELVSIPLAEGNLSAELATVFLFNNQYSVASEMNPSLGYWVKTRTFETESYEMTGPGIESQSIQLNEGWNLIGSLSDTVDVDDIFDPENIISSAPLFTYQDGQYVERNALVPNKGYWIHSLSSGVIEMQINTDPNSQNLNISNSLTASEGQLMYQPDNDKIIFHNGGHVKAIQMSNSAIHSSDLNRYLLPPLSPYTNLDIRTHSNLKIVSHDETSKLDLKSSYYPVTVHLEGESELNNNRVVRFRLVYETREHTAELRAGQTLMIHEEPEFIEITIESASGTGLISESKLLPNYPNPFNPATTIQYQLKDQSHVKIEVFDIAGRRVGVLADNVMQSGEYRVEFDAQNLASGIYIVRFQNADRVDLRKITLIK